VVYLAGRPEHCREVTLAWFRRYDVPDGELHLRRPGDRHPARLVKVEVLDRLSRRAPDEQAALRAAQEAEGRT
jgi:hypothetical protein